ncbi:hypothetical protein Pmani_001188 [Petrolisthes manimaculis]|uniref:DUF7041 domain-containing protein n=1 Tax=Petrolisthes manimaculis TaxID=1843537 RepID=A0AAE1QKM1_9EUCA|nr:hypothetical protein Pmani_001188 [Petrolisthes manimaculis]
MAEPQDIEPIPTISTFRAPPFSSHDPTLWFTILEVNFRAHHITTIKGMLSLEDLAQLADEFMDTIPNETTICNITSSNEISQLKDLISSLAEQVSELKLQVKQQSPAYPPSPRRHRSRSRDSRNTSTNSNFNGMCYYHHSFGKNAHHCQQPCSYIRETTPAVTSGP